MRLSVAFQGHGRLCRISSHTARYRSAGGLLLRAAALLALVQFLASSARATLVGPVDLGTLPNYLLVFTDGSAGGVIDYNLQGASKGYVGNIAVNGIAAGTNLRTSGTVPYAGTMYTNAPTLDSWQSIVDANRIPAIGQNQASAVYNDVSRLSTLQIALTSAFTQINALPATPGFTSVSSSVLNGLNTQDGINETFVINVTSGFSVSSKLNVTGDPGDTFILRWDTDANSANGYNGQVKFQSGGGIVPLGGLSPTNFINVAGDINSSGGGTTPAPPYPQGARLNDGTGPLIVGGADFDGGGFFTGYWLTTGDPSNGQTSPLSNAIFVGGWYSNTDKFSLTSGSSGVSVTPPPPGNGVPEPSSLVLVALGGLGACLLAIRRRGATAR
jgi:PEP-CTERM motif-containing protein